MNPSAILIPDKRQARRDPERDAAGTDCADRAQIFRRLHPFTNSKNHRRKQTIMSKQKADELPSANTEPNTQNERQGQKETQGHSLHTPGPLEISSSVIVVSNSGPDLKVICSTAEFASVTPMSLEESMANAKRIVQSWNAFGDLLEACKALIAVDELEFDDYVKRFGFGNDYARANARKVLRKVQQP